MHSPSQFSRFHIIPILSRPVINAVITTYVIRHYNCTNTLGILFITSVQAKTDDLAYLSDTNCLIQANESDYDTTSTPQASKKQHRQLLQVHQRTFLILKERNNDMSHMYERHSATGGQLKILRYKNPIMQYVRIKYCTSGKVWVL
jgi:hypothetical protein